MKSRLSAFFGTLAGLAALTTNAAAQDIPPCTASGNVDDNGFADYRLHEEGYAHMSLYVPVPDLEIENLDETEGKTPFIEFSLMRTADGPYNKTYSVMLYLGELKSPQTGKLVDAWTYTTTFNGVDRTVENINFELPNQKYPDYPSRLGLLGTTSRPVTEHVAWLRAGSPMTVTGYASTRENEKVSATIDMTKAAKVFAALENMDKTIVANAADGKCLPV